MFRRMLLLAPLALPAPAMAQSFLACRVDGGGQLRLTLEPGTVALQQPGRQIWQEAADVTSMRDPVIASFAQPLPAEASPRATAHEGFTLVLDRMTGALRLSLLRRPSAEQVEACRSAAQVAAEANSTQAEPPATPPPPCDLPLPVASLGGMCEPLRTRF